MSKNAKFAVGAAAVLFLVAGACAAFLWIDDPEIAELRQMRDEMFREDRSDDERRQFRDDFRNRIEQLSDDQRRQFFRDSQPMYINMARQRMDDFFELPQEEQRQRVAEIADRIVERRAQGDGGGRGPGAGRGPGGGRANMTEAQRDERRKRMLDATDPKMRGQFDKFRDMLNDELANRGEPPMEGPPRGLFR